MTISITTTITLVSAKVECTTTRYCEDFLHVGSECINGHCTNPLYQGGCLHQYLPGWTKLRVCHSEDPPEAEAMGYCTKSEFQDEYVELRIFSQNWESVFFQTWILQILLSEILQVPTTVETGLYDVNVNLYDIEMRMDYGLSNVNDGLVRANAANGDCTVYDKSSSETYQPCGHVVPEVWSGQRERYLQLQSQGIIDPLLGLGSVGHNQWFIPKFVAQEQPALLSYLGLMGDENRQLLADTFKQPTTWKDYCDLISVDNCLTSSDTNNTNTNSTSDMTVAIRPPKDESEEGMYFLEGVYNGYFRDTPQHNCTANPTTCTGTFIEYPCGWSSFAVPQIYYNDIALTSTKYLYGELIQIIYAANATKSPIAFQWWTPELLYQKFVGTDFEFHRVGFPATTQQCLESRIKSEDRCSDDSAEQRGDPIGSCDEAPHTLHKALAESLYRSSKDPTIPIAARSPAYDVIAAFDISDFQTGELFDYWLRVEKDQYTNDGREGTCQWVVENFDWIESFIPKSFPRTKRKTDDSFRSEPLHYAALIAGTVSTVFVIVVAIGTYQQRERRVFQTAQLEFLYILLLGLFMVALAAIVSAIPPTDASCVAVVWLFNVGYTLELVPLIVKVAAINRLVHAAQQYRRVVLRRQDLFGTVFFLSFLMVIFCIIWTIMDPPRNGTELILTDNSTSDGMRIVNVSSYCQSENDYWRFISVGCNSLLLIAATVLAFQTRNLRHGINETQTLAILIYSHFFFVLLRVMTYFLESALGAAKTALFRSFLLSGDIIATVVIYFIPKFFFSKDDNNSPGGGPRRAISGLTQNHQMSFVNSSRTHATGGFYEDSRRGEIQGEFNGFHSNLNKDEQEASRETYLSSSNPKISSAANPSSLGESQKSLTTSNEPPTTIYEGLPSDELRSRTSISATVSSQIVPKTMSELSFTQRSLSSSTPEDETINGLQYMAGPNEMSEKTNKLIELNFTVLKRLLKRVIAKRGQAESKSLLTSSSSATDALQPIREDLMLDLYGEGKTILGEVQNIIPFVKDKRSYEQDPETVEINLQVAEQLKDLVSSIASMYRDNAYHNFELASHVTQSCTMLLSRIHSNSTDPECHYVQLIQSDPLVAFAAAFSSLVSFLDHTGVSNHQLKHEKARISDIYNHRSVAQQNAADLGWNILTSPNYNQLHECLFSNQEESNRFRQLFINASMAVDINNSEIVQSRQRNYENAFKAKAENSDDGDGDGKGISNSSNDNSKATIVFETLIKAASLSFTMQHWQVYIKWNERRFDESRAAFEAGRMAENPLDDWYEQEMQLFQMHIVPIATILMECGIFEKAFGGEFLKYAKGNRQQWEENGKQIVTNYLKKYQN